VADAEGRPIFEKAGESKNSGRKTPICACSPHFRVKQQLTPLKKLSGLHVLLYRLVKIGMREHADRNDHRFTARAQAILDQWKPILCNDIPNRHWVQKDPTTYQYVSGKVNEGELSPVLHSRGSQVGLIS